MRTPTDNGEQLFRGEFKPAVIVLPPGQRTQVQVKAPGRLPAGYPPVPGMDDAFPINNLTQSYGGT